MVERSVNDRTFERIGEVMAAGQSNAVLSYGYLDSKTTISGQKVLYYRLKQLDENGNFEYSTVVAIRNDKANVEVSVFPNPFTHTLLVNLPETEKAGFKLTTATGKTLYLKDKRQFRE